MNRPSNMSVSALPLFAILLLPFLVIACVPVGPTPGPPIRVAVQPHQLSPFPCEDGFVPHPLDHTTSIEDEVVRTYDSNGAGLAVNDLDNDGDGWLDIVSARRTTFPFRACLAISLPSTATEASNLDLLLAMTSLSVPNKLGATQKLVYIFLSPC